MKIIYGIPNIGRMEVTLTGTGQPAHVCITNEGRKLFEGAVPEWEGVSSPLGCHVIRVAAQTLGNRDWLAYGSMSPRYESISLRGV